MGHFPAYSLIICNAKESIHKCGNKSIDNQLPSHHSKHRPNPVKWPVRQILAGWIECNIIYLLQVLWAMKWQQVNGAFLWRWPINSTPYAHSSISLTACCMVKMLSFICVLSRTISASIYILPLWKAFLWHLWIPNRKEPMKSCNSQSVWISIYFTLLINCLWSLSCINRSCAIEILLWICQSLHMNNYYCTMIYWCCNPLQHDSFNSAQFVNR